MGSLLNICWSLQWGVLNSSGGNIHVKVLLPVRLPCLLSPILQLTLKTTCFQETQEFGVTPTDPLKESRIFFWTAKNK